MRHLRYFFIFGLALLIFMGAFLGEQSYWTREASVQNPFLDTVDPKGRWNIVHEDHVRRMLTKEGEFFLPKAGTSVNFDNREFEQGELLWSSNFAHPDTIKPWFAEGAPSEMSAGWMRMGPIKIFQPGGTVFLDRTQRGIAVITAYDHGLDVFFPERGDPFVVPVGVSVQIKLSDEGWEDRSFAEIQELIRLARGASPEERWIKELRQLRDYRNAMVDFVRRMPATWIRFRVSTLWGRFMGGVQDGQRLVAIALGNDEQYDLLFKKLVAPYVEAHDLYLENESISAKPYLEAFRENMRQEDWKSLPKKNLYTEIWRQYELSVRALLKNTLSEDKDRYLGNFWESQFAPEGLAYWEDVFREVEMLVREGSFSKARMKAESLFTGLPQIKLKKEDRMRITNLRRKLTAFLQDRPSFQKDSMFAGYQTLLSLEQSLLPEVSQDNFKAELTPNIVGWFHQFLGNDLSESALAILLSLYDTFTDATLVSDEDQELIEIIRSVESVKLTADRIASIRRTQEQQNAFQEELQELESSRVVEVPVVQDKNRITNVRNLKSFLEDLEIFIPARGFHTIPVEGVTEFSQGLYQGLSVSGAFDYTTQYFLIFVVGDHTNEQFHARFLKGVMGQSLREVVKTTLDLKTKNEGRLVAQSETAQVVREKEIVKRSLKAAGFSVLRKDIHPRRSNFSSFQIKEMVWERGGIETSGMYDREADTFSNIYILTQGRGISLGQQEVPRKELGRMIQDKMEELTLRK